jgi:hypothetical protein
VLEEAERTKAFRKDPKEEDFLSRLNETLFPYERTFHDDVSSADCRPIFIVGAPRSGTTLLGQVLMSAGFGYISNFLARFWRAPSVGMKLQRALIGERRNLPTHFSSRYGVTSDLMDAHEFGYYWDQWFDLGQETHVLSQEERSVVDVGQMTRSVAALCGQFDLPLVFKNTTWCSAQADFLADCFPKSVFVFIERHPIFAAQSILVARRERYGSDEVWWSNRPSTFAELKRLSPCEQVIGQVIDFVGDTEKSLSRVPSDRVVRLDYEHLCSDPKVVVHKVAEAAKCTVDLDLVPQRFDQQDRQRVGDEDWRLLNSAYESRSRSKLQTADSGD